MSYKVLSGFADRLFLTPLFAGRSCSSVRRATRRRQPAAVVVDEGIDFSPVPGAPQACLRVDGGEVQFAERPQWHYRLIHEADRLAGLEHREDLFSPGCLCIDMSSGRVTVAIGLTPVRGASAVMDRHREQREAAQQSG